MGYRVLADAVVVVHYCFLATVIFGGYVAIRWRRFIWVNVTACAWAITIMTVPGLVCPLTIAQNWALERAGAAQYTGGFIDNYVKGVIYPAGYTLAVQVIVGLAVLTSWLLFYRGRSRTVAAAPQM